MLSYTAPRATIQQLLQKHVLPVNKNLHVQKVLQRIKTCRTSALGYHVYQCSDDQCGHIKYQYHSCRDRHCPNCGAIKKQEWIEARRQELLPVKYYHVVFTLPHRDIGYLLSDKNNFVRENSKAVIPQKSMLHTVEAEILYLASLAPRATIRNPGL